MRFLVFFVDSLYGVTYLCALGTDGDKPKLKKAFSFRIHVVQYFAKIIVLYFKANLFYVINIFISIF
jgi:hypothetical protein